MATPKLVRYEAPGWGVGEVWLDGQVVLWSELPRPAVVPDPNGRAESRVAPPTATVRRNRPSPEGARLAQRVKAFFAGAADDFADLELDLEDGFHGDCARALRRVSRGEVVTYGELAALAGRPGAARAAGTFCARSHLTPFVPCHRVVAAGGIGSFGSLGVEYKRRMLALEDVAL